MHFLVLRRSLITPIQRSQPCSSVTSLLQFRNGLDYTCIHTHIVRQWPHTVNPTLKTFPLTSVSVTSAARCVSRENTPRKRHKVDEKTGSQRWEVNCDSQRHSWYDTHTHIGAVKKAVPDSGALVGDTHGAAAWLVGDQPWTGNVLLISVLGTSTLQAGC